jgi:hypothetical protein
VDQNWIAFDPSWREGGNDVERHLRDAPRRRGHHRQPQAQVIADRWLQANRPGEHAGVADAFPGCYTVHTLRGDLVVGMLSVVTTTWIG